MFEKTTERKIGVTLNHKGDSKESWVSEYCVNRKKLRRNFSTKKYGYNFAYENAVLSRLEFEETYKNRSRDNEIFMKEILMNIMDFYGYDFEIKISVYEDLIDWLITLEETDKCMVNEGVNRIWKREIDLIKLIEIK